MSLNPVVVLFALPSHQLSGLTPPRLLIYGAQSFRLALNFAAKHKTNTHNTHLNNQKRLKYWMEETVYIYGYIEYAWGGRRRAAANRTISWREQSWAGIFRLFLFFQCSERRSNILPWWLSAAASSMKLDKHFGPTLGLIHALWARQDYGAVCSSLYTGTDCVHPGCSVLLYLERNTGRNVEWSWGL